MKNFDIEKLDRKNIYKTPENFFDKIRENVLYNAELNKKEVAKPAKIFKLNWGYAVAASLVLVFGMTMFLQQDNHVVEVNTQPKTIATTENTTPEATIAYQTLASDIESVEKENKKPEKISTLAIPQKKSESIAIASTKIKPNTTIPVVSEAQFEQVMAGLSYTEIADVGKGAEQDVYLDLYN